MNLLFCSKCSPMHLNSKVNILLVRSTWIKAFILYMLTLDIILLKIYWWLWIWPKSDQQTVTNGTLAIYIIYIPLMLDNPRCWVNQHFIVWSLSLMTIQHVGWCWNMFDIVSNIWSNTVQHFFHSYVEWMFGISWLSLIFNILDCPPLQTTRQIVQHLSFGQALVIVYRLYTID